MKNTEIRSIFSSKVAELLAQGFEINPGTMGGSQGEVAHIDFAKDGELYRLLLTDESGYGEDEPRQTTRIFFGKVTDHIRAPERLDHSIGNIVWNNHLEQIFQIDYCNIDDRCGRNWYVSREEALAAGEKRFQRWRSRITPGKHRLEGDAYKSIALRWLQRTQKGFKTAQVADIKSVTRVNRNNWGRTTPELACYEIETTKNAKTYRVSPPRRE